VKHPDSAAGQFAGVGLDGDIGFLPGWSMYNDYYGSNIIFQIRGETMAELASLECPSCGGKFQISNDIDCFACDYCGIDYVVKKNGGILSISPIAIEIKKFSTGVYDDVELAYMKINGKKDDQREPKKEWNQDSAIGCLVIGIVLIPLSFVIFSIKENFQVRWCFFSVAMVYWLLYLIYLIQVKIE
jgi:hypothetical protein